MGAKRMRTSRQQLIEEPATLADRTANGAGADAEPARKLALGEGDLQELLERLDAGLEYEGDLETENDHIELFNVEAAQDLFADAATAIRALSSQDHADAGKVEGDGWMPIESAPKDGTVIQAWHQVHKCPISVLWKDDGFPYRGKRLNWYERTYTTAWPEHVFFYWRPLPSAPSHEVAGS